MQQLTTVKQKYVTKMTNPSTPPPTFKNVGDCSHNPLRIDAPVSFLIIIDILIQ